MAYVLNAQEFLPSVHGRRCTPASNSPASKPGILRRAVQAMFEWRQAQADREIARFLARSGGRLPGYRAPADRASVEPQFGRLLAARRRHHR